MNKKLAERFGDMYSEIFVRMVSRVPDRLYFDWITRSIPWTNDKEGNTKGLINQCRVEVAEQLEKTIYRTGGRTTVFDLEFKTNCNVLKNLIEKYEIFGNGDKSTVYKTIDDDIN